MGTAGFRVAGVVFQQQLMKLPWEGCPRSGSQGEAAWPAGGTTRGRSGVSRLSLTAFTLEYQGLPHSVRSTQKLLVCLCLFWSSLLPESVFPGACFPWGARASWVWCVISCLNWNEISLQHWATERKPHHGDDPGGVFLPAPPHQCRSKLCFPCWIWSFDFCWPPFWTLIHTCHSSKLSFSFWVQILWPHPNPTPRTCCGFGRRQLPRVALASVRSCSPLAASPVSDLVLSCGLSDDRSHCPPSAGVSPQHVQFLKDNFIHRPMRKTPWYRGWNLEFIMRFWVSDGHARRKKNHSFKCSQAIHGTKSWVPVQAAKLAAPCFIATQRRVDYYSRFWFLKLISKSFKSVLMAAWFFFFSWVLAPFNSEYGNCLITGGKSNFWYLC